MAFADSSSSSFNDVYADADTDADDADGVVPVRAAASARTRLSEKCQTRSRVYAAPPFLTKF